MRGMVLGAAALVLVGCMPEVEKNDDIVFDTDACGASELQDFVGKPVSEIGQRDKMRILRPDSLATSDYRTDRLNVAADENDIIESITCG